jgi:hypothetical protein
MNRCPAHRRRNQIAFCWNHWLLEREKVRLKFYQICSKRLSTVLLLHFTVFSVSPARKPKTSDGIIGGDSTVSSNKDLKKIFRYLGKVLYELKRNNDEIGELHRLYKNHTNQNAPPISVNLIKHWNRWSLDKFKKDLSGNYAELSSRAFLIAVPISAC